MSGRSLPRLLVLTDREQSESAGRSLGETILAAVDGGARAILLREKDLHPEARRHLALRIRELMRAVEGLLMVASDAALARRVDADGVHLAAGDPGSPLAGMLVGRSCHDAKELERAVRGAVDYVTISPVFPSPSKPGYGPPLDAESLDLMLRQAPSPLTAFALGGVTPGRAAQCLRVGAHGVAVMSAVMRAADPAKVVADLLEEMDSERGPAPGALADRARKRE